MRNALAVALGGAAGSVLRYWMGLALLGASRALPVNTLVINVAGAFVLGVILATVPATQTPTRLLLGTGFCGGFTTFSTFSAEVVALAERGQATRAAGYAIGSVLLGLVAVLGGTLVGRSLGAR
jgi:fluoride exporter